ncbi:MAG: hypothetical protein RLZ04_283 [Actinomycetota bacterium]
MTGLGTIVNVVAIVAGAGLGVLLGHRLPDRTRTTVTEALGLVTLVIGALNVVAILDDPFKEAVGDEWPLLVVLGALVIGGIVGSLCRMEDRLEDLGGWLQSRMVRGEGSHGRFVEGFVTSSLLFCIGPLAILGALSDGLGEGRDQLMLKSALDFFASVAFASTLGWGVAASAIAVGVYQGAMTLAGVALGSVMPDALISAITATGGMMLLGVGFRMLEIRRMRVADMLPALVVAPLLTELVSRLR